VGFLVLLSFVFIFPALSIFREPEATAMCESDPLAESDRAKKPKL
jgi:hypothetical protein